MKKRFYDQDPSVSQAIELLLVFPEDMQAVIADGLSTIAEQEFQANEIINDFKSLGTEKVLAIYKSKQKQRSYDNNPTVHRALNYMMILSPENRLFISKRIIELIGYLQDYLKTCKLHEATPTLPSVERIRDVYIQFGPEDASRFLQAMEQEFTRKLRMKGEEPQKALVEAKKDEIIITEEITSEGLGMKIRGDIR